MSVIGTHRAKHWNKIYDLAYSPDRRFVASVAPDSPLRAAPEGDAEGGLHDGSTSTARSRCPLVEAPGPPAPSERDDYDRPKDCEHGRNEPEFQWLIQQNVQRRFGIDQQANALADRACR